MKKHSFLDVYGYHDSFSFLFYFLPSFASFTVPAGATATE